MSTPTTDPTALSCADTAKRELQYLHDIQIIQKELLKFFAGSSYFSDKVLPKLCKDVDNPMDFGNIGS